MAARRTHPSLGWAAGCVVCQAAGLKSQWGKMEVTSAKTMMLNHVKRHAETNMHKQATIAYLGGHP